MVVPTKKQIEDQIGLCIENPTIYPGMNYADGVRAALEWVLGYSENQPPIENENEN